MYDLNLDVNDFPKKAATLEGNHLLSHLNGSSDMQQIDLDLSPLSLGTFKSHLDLVNGWEDTNVASSPNAATNTSSGLSAASKDIQRLHTTTVLSKLIGVRSPERRTSTGSDSSPQVPAQTVAKSKEDTSDPKNTAVGNGGVKSKKNKKQQQQQQKQEPSVPEQTSNKPTKAASGNEAQKTSEIKEMVSIGSKSGNKQPQHSADNQRNGPKKAEEGRSSKHAAHAANGASSGTQRGKFDPETRGGRSEQESESKAHPAILANGPQQQQPKGKTKKNKNKGEKSSSALGTRGEFYSSLSFKLPI